MKTFRKTPLLLCLLIIGIASCKKSGIAPPGIKGKDLGLTSLDLQKVTADNAFAIKLFKNLDSANAASAATAGSNLFVSPLSVSFALGMTSNGAAGQTLTAFQNTLNFAGLTQAQVNNYYNTLITNLPQLDPNTTVDIANSIWYRQDFSVLPQFLQTNSTNFHAQIQALDFTSPTAKTTINNWVSNNTKGFIPTIIDQIPSDAEMFLVNAIYFKSSWQESFDPANTKQQAFYLADNSQVQTSFMTGNIDFNYYTDANVNVYELPYSNNKYSMVIVLPIGSNTVPQLTAALSPAQWQTWMTDLKPVNSPITLPKFKFSFGANLNDALTDLGLGVAFSDDANFSLINPTASLKISQVLHKAFVETDESGTTAAAATSVGIITSIAFQPFTTVINRPFIFAIREVSSGLIVFAGTVNNPTLAGE
jgi:serpin B